MIRIHGYLLKNQEKPIKLAQISKLYLLYKYLMIKSRKDFEVGDYFLRFSKLESYKVGKLYHYFPTSRSPRGIVDDYRTFIEEFITFCYTEEAEKLWAGLSSVLRTG